MTSLYRWGAPVEPIAKPDLTNEGVGELATLFRGLATMREVALGVSECLGPDNKASVLMEAELDRVTFIMGRIADELKARTHLEKHWVRAEILARWALECGDWKGAAVSVEPLALTPH
ncbi:hypothetical protein CHELA1G11_12962 [Hyphomicrobiales bacterium]|nr:hypothetical protein CHELA1G2_11347 [Hyphomicrobiales bacterium]CAH1668343.1 hypothetical protein CHELA1G11_12962 [Hyphomicrobiales bacterium]